MNSLVPITRNMPDRAVNTEYYISFMESLKEPLNFGNSAGGNATLNTLLIASVTNSYVEVSSQLTGISGQTVRNHLRDNSILSKPLKVAIDWHDEMYYGNTGTEGIIGTKNKAGTNYAYEYATASIVVKGKRFAIAAIPVTERTILDMVIKLIDIIKYHGISVSALLMDS